MSKFVITEEAIKSWDELSKNELVGFFRERELFISAFRLGVKAYFRFQQEAINKGVDKSDGIDFETIDTIIGDIEPELKGETL